MTDTPVTKLDSQKAGKTDDGAGARKPNAIELIAAERSRQVSQEGWTPEHDDQHTDSEMVRAAVCYARRAAHQIAICDDWPVHLPDDWPWDESWWKPTDPLPNLVKAGALIAAEIDRLQREKPSLSMKSPYRGQFAERGEVGSVGQGERRKVEKREGYTYVGLDEKAQSEAGAVTPQLPVIREWLTTQTQEWRKEPDNILNEPGVINFVAQLILSYELSKASVAPSVEELDEAAQKIDAHYRKHFLGQGPAGHGCVNVHAEVVVEIIRAALERKQSQ
jgi:hypothetical protein